MGLVDIVEVFKRWHRSQLPVTPAVVGNDMASANIGRNPPFAADPVAAADLSRHHKEHRLTDLGAAQPGDDSPGPLVRR